jgi:hypothetical protein
MFAFYFAALCTAFKHMIISLRTNCIPGCLSRYFPLQSTGPFAILRMETTLPHLCSFLMYPQVSVGGLLHQQHEDVPYCGGRDPFVYVGPQINITVFRDGTPCSTVNMCRRLRLNNQQDASSVQNFILSRNSSCFGHLLCPSSGVISCTRGNWYVSCRLSGRCLGESGSNLSDSYMRRARNIVL